MRKPRSDSKLLNLPEEQQSQLVDWILSGIPYHQVRSMVETTFGVRTSVSALSCFHSQVCLPAYLGKRARVVKMADEVAQAAESAPGRFDQATIDALKNRAFEMAIQPAANPKDVKSLFMLVLKSRDQDLMERRVRILEQRAKQAEDAEQVVKSSLTPEEKQAKFKEIFGLA